MTHTFFLLGALAVVAGACASDPGSASGRAAVAAEAENEASPLRYRLEARETYVAGEPVAIGFTLENVSDGTLWVLRWYTPLEGVAGKIFDVTRDGEPLPYQGLMAKRGDPRREDYVRLAPGESASQEVDLAEAWDLSAAGEIRAAFVGRVWDVVRDEASLPRTRDEHQGMEVPGDPVTFRLVEP